MGTSSAMIVARFEVQNPKVSRTALYQLSYDLYHTDLFSWRVDMFLLVNIMGFELEGPLIENYIYFLTLSFSNYT